MQKTYEAPRLTAIGSLTELTLGGRGNGHDDSFLWFHWGS
jgi:hypothetical protein|nr:lasso RiPP family leader peptide-containing protein [Propionicimonas sp.]